jgi:ribonuclease HII
MSLTLLRYRRLFGEDLPIVALDDRRLRKWRLQSEEVATYLQREKRRLSQLERHERKARKDGAQVIAGVDEVGRGPLAGPLVAAAVVFEKNPWIPLLDDSKKLSPEEREAIFELIQRRASSWSIGIVSVEELNASNMHRATLQAMSRAVAGLSRTPDCILVDGRHAIPELGCRQQALVKGDSLSLSIAAASVLAKVTRDRHMDEMDALYPHYGFKRHKGYATAEHLAALDRVGPSPIHRRLFSPVAASFVVEDRQLEFL